MNKVLRPFEISTSLDLEKGVLCVENKTGKDWRNITLILHDGYAQDICLEVTDINAGERVEAALNRRLHFYNFENGLRLRVYSGGGKMYERVFNHKRRRSFVFYSNKEFESITKCAIKGLRNFSETEVVYYTVGFESDLEIKGVECKRHDVDKEKGDLSDSQYMQMIKPVIFLRALDDGIEDGIFIDSDVQLRDNIDQMFERFSHIDPQTPVLNRNYWQFLFVGENYIPQEELKTVMGYAGEKQFQGHGVTNIFLFRKEMRRLLEKWRFWCQQEEMLNVLRKRVYVHDEVIFNVLCWKDEVKQIHANLLFNVTGLKDVKAFHHLSADEGQSHLDMNRFGCGHFSQSFMPYDKTDIVGFHCVKDPLAAERINDYLKSVSKSK